MHSLKELCFPILKYVESADTLSIWNFNKIFLDYNITHLIPVQTFVGCTYYFHLFINQLKKVNLTKKNFSFPLMNDPINVQLMFNLC